MSTLELLVEEFNKLMVNGPEGAQFVECIAEELFLFYKDEERKFFDRKDHTLPPGWKRFDKCKPLAKDLFLLTRIRVDEHLLYHRKRLEVSGWFRIYEEKPDDCYLLKYDSGNLELSHPETGRRSEFFVDYLELPDGLYELTDRKGKQSHFDTKKNTILNSLSKRREKKEQKSYEVNRRHGHKRFYNLVNGERSDSFSYYRDLSHEWKLLNAVRDKQQKQQFYHPVTGRSSEWLSNVTICHHKGDKSSQVRSDIYGTTAIFDLKDGKMGPFQMVDDNVLTDLVVPRVDVGGEIIHDFGEKETTNTIKFQT